jgi:hypothetical protein
MQHRKSFPSCLVGWRLIVLLLFRLLSRGRLRCLRCFLYKMLCCGEESMKILPKASKWTFVCSSKSPYLLSRGLRNPYFLFFLGILAGLKVARILVMIQIGTHCAVADQKGEFDVVVFFRWAKQGRLEPIQQSPLLFHGVIRPKKFEVT